MKKLLIISFDIIRDFDTKTTFSVGSILSYLKSSKQYKYEFDFEHLSINLNENQFFRIDFNMINCDWDEYDFIAISCYVWSHQQSLELMQWIKAKRFKAQIIVGGYQINKNDITYLKQLYPNANHYILGYAEESLLQIISNQTQSVILKSNVNFDLIPSPYVSGVISLSEDIKKVRLETKRGCPYQCTFCAQHDLEQTKTKQYREDRNTEELKFLSQYNIDRISVTDPVFNMGKNYVDYLKIIKLLGMKTQFNFQVRPELIHQKKDYEFLDLIAETNSEIELGLQTLDEGVNKLIKRNNKYEPIEFVVKQLVTRNINFGISLIYGLPTQTLSSFENDLKQLQDWGVKNVVAYPLMLLEGTAMHTNKEHYKIKEKSFGEYSIPYVVESLSFTQKEWEKMHSLAIEINPKERLF